LSIRVKIVPDIHPNADGEWIELAVDLSPAVLRSWQAQEVAVMPFVPKGYHVVAVKMAEPSVPGVRDRFSGLDIA
jgi:hypothetical protein